MDSFLILMGIGFTTLLLAVVIYLVWILFLWPFVEAVSLTRMSLAYRRLNAHKIGAATAAKLFVMWYGETVFGRRFYAIHSRGWRWEAVGKWWVYKDEHC
ncbi:hypothetical protein NOU17_23325 [Salmonella enterica subsp. enterica serovar Typhimurium]|uniref:hypothetical protein n=1 Tax=Salmonella enterica TaxID=28901 RepID=UPI00215752C3|nr:hypothetical protein [Salmonella enterica]ECN2450330.1 hypothetical protein [Salmonella enterica subsp. enterica serovar Typhimurium]MCR8589358.1 hypothetical protein [Salmonella enterica subsp. enterica serovar Typhimurium]MCR8603307.1 hypothetical protein [Salmonella enterica subsp. enterica serovar Typhimurium]